MKDDLAFVRQYPYFFDMDFIRSSHKNLADKSDKDIAEICLSEENANPPRPNFIFDIDYVKAQIPDGDAPLDHGNPILNYFFDIRCRTFRPNPLFSPSHFRLSVGLTMESRSNTVNHALSGTLERGVSFHPLIDTRHIASQLDCDDDLALIEKILLGKIGRIDPHPLFSIEYLEQKTGEKFKTMLDAVSFYENSENDYQTHYLFSPEFYEEQATLNLKQKKSLIDYIQRGGIWDPHPLFNTSHYRRNAYRRFGIIVDRPLEHFLLKGMRAQIDCSPYFDISYYLQRVGLDVDAYHHYLEEGGFRYYSPHPLIDVDEYRIDEGDTEPESEIPAIDFALHPWKNKPQPIAFFDPSFYKNQHQDQVDENGSAISHFLNGGMQAGERPNAMFSPKSLLTTIRNETFHAIQPTEYYFRYQLHRRDRICVALADLENNDANQRMLALVRELSRIPDVEVICVAPEDGPAHRAFRQYAHVELFHMRFDKDQLDVAKASKRVGQFFTQLGTNRPRMALCHRPEDVDLYKLFAAYNVPVIALIEKFSDTNGERIQDIAESSSAVIFRSNWMKDYAKEEFGLTGKNLQGGAVFLSESRPAERMVGDLSREEVLEKLELPNDAFIVFNSAPLDLVSGLDDFCTVARLFCQEFADADKVFFVWQGSGPMWPNTPYFYANHEMRISGFGDRLAFAEGELSFEELCLAADVYFCPNGTAPHPDKILRAKSFGLPVVTNDSNTAASEFCGPDCGIVYSEKDYAEGADAIHSLYADETLRSVYGQAALKSYRKKWQFENSFNIIRNLLLKNSLRRIRGLASPKKKKARQENFIILDDAGTKSAYYEHIEKNVGSGRKKPVFINGRFGPEANEFITANGIDDFEILQPNQNDIYSKLYTLREFMHERRDAKFWLFDMEDRLDEEFFMDQSGSIALVITDNNPDMEKIYQLGLFPEEIYIPDSSFEQRMRGMNPLIADKMIPMSL